MLGDFRTHHDKHIADLDHPSVSMGHHLRASLGAEMLTVGLEVGDGEFQALRVRSDGARPNVEAIELGPPEGGLANAALLRAGPPLYLVDLRALPHEGEVADWFHAPQLVRQAGYRVGDTPGWIEPMALADAYDALLFAAHTTRARPLPVDLERSP